MAYGGLYSLIIRYIPAVCIDYLFFVLLKTKQLRFIFMQPETWEDARVVVISQNRTQANITLCGNQTYEQEQTFKLLASM